MTDNIKDGGPAFPAIEQYQYGGGSALEYFGGMSLRDWFAGMALQGMLASETEEWGFRQTQGEPETREQLAAKHAYKMADAMIAEREKGRAV